MAKSPSEQIRELTSDVNVLEERVDTLLAEMNLRRVSDEKRRDEIAELRRELTVARQESAVLHQRFEDHLARYQEWDRRRWALFLVLIGAVFSLASGLIVSLARK